MLGKSTPALCVRARASRPLACALFAFSLVLAAAGCSGERVRLRVAPGVDRYRSRRLIAPLEFRARCKELLYEVELHVGYGQGHGHPLEGFLFNTQVRWNAATRPLSGYFAELCQLHNVGAITIEGFERREGELRAALQQLAAQRRQLDAVLEAYRKAAKANSPSVEAHRHDAEQILERAAEIIRSLNEEP